jgi:hypothetical protein
MNKLYFEKYANFDRINEPVSISIPFAKGMVFDINKLRVFNDKGDAKSQALPLAYWNDGSVKWAKVDFMADLPANKDAVYYYCLDKDDGKTDISPVSITAVKDMLDNLNIEGPYIEDREGNRFFANFDGPWTIEEQGPVLIKISAKGSHKSLDGIKFMDYIIIITAYADTPWLEVQYRIINNLEPDYTIINKIAIDIHFDKSYNDSFSAATSNYHSDIRTNTSNMPGLYTMIDADYLLNDANEQTPEVFYGSFFADWNSKDKGGLCVTLHQAYQNFPKALLVNKEMMSIEILPAEHGGIKYYRGMAKNHTFFLHFHGGGEPIESINKRSLMLQHRDKPVLPASVYDRSGCYPNLFPRNKSTFFDSFIMGMADNRGKAYGMLHWGDCPDGGYSMQGRGGGDYVWTNNEYDFPLAAFQLYALSGERRVLDYALTAAAHWADIDVCHYDKEPLRQGAQYEHSKDHVTGNIDISHQWVEGLFACYHQTGDRFMYETAIGIGRNILRYLEQPKYREKGGFNARDTGWALRALTALYIETNDVCWLNHADLIVSHFSDWKDAYGGWFSPYTDHTVVRVPFMISIAVGSLMRYYRVKQDDRIKEMIVDAVEDLIENAMLPNGLFYYKELPSLRKPAASALLLEALACAYELTGDKKYLRAGIPTFMRIVTAQKSGGGKKEKIQDGVLLAGPGPKGFAQSFYPLMYYFSHAEGLLELRNI